jgi:two-component system response regulator AtoC
VQKRILVLDDEPLMLHFLTETLNRKKYQTHSSKTPTEALKLLKLHPFDLLITDMKMPEMSGIQLIKLLRKEGITLPVIVITAYGSIENAVEAMQLGAVNYLIKPFSPDLVETVVHAAMLQKPIAISNSSHAAISSSRKGNFLFHSPVMQEIIEASIRYAKSNAPIFINGESGTGKEVIAEIIHQNSSRSNEPYIRVNCAAIPESLLESEFFGHEKGSFTGANNRRLGRFEQAHRGTLLLDEVTEIPYHLQAKFLRAIQENEIERVGGEGSISINVRYIATSNRNMPQALLNREFREDLFYRLSVIPIYLPPLRERQDDIIPLALHFIQRACQKNQRELVTLSPSAEALLLAYPWPGNIRQLSNVIERTIVMGASAQIEAQHLHFEGTQIVQKDKEKSKTLDDLEKEFIIETLIANHHNRQATAVSLGITNAALLKKLSSYGITSK